MKILLFREREVIKVAEKDPSAIVIASICSTGATVVGSINATEFWQRQTQPPSQNYYCCVAKKRKKWILQFRSDPLFILAAK